MSFDINNWGRWSVSYNSFPPTAWAYTGIANGGLDTLDTMKVSGFFDEAINFVKVGHLIYLVGKSIAPIFPSRELVVVTGINPVTVESLNGVTPLFAGVNTASFQADDVLTIQPFNLPGVLPTDLIMVNTKVNPGTQRLKAAITGTDEFILTFTGAPGVGVLLDALIFRESFM